MIQNLQTLAKTSVDNTYDFIQIQNSSTGALKKLLAAGLFPTMSTTGTGGQELFISVTNSTA